MDMLPAGWCQMTDAQGVYYLNLLTKERTRVKPANNLNFQPIANSDASADNSPDIKPLPPAIKPLPQPPPAPMNPLNQNPSQMMMNPASPNMMSPMSPQQYQMYQYQQQQQQ